MNANELFIFAVRLIFKETTMLKLLTPKGKINFEKHVSAEKQYE